MDAELRQILLSWDFRPDVSLVLVLAGLLYVRGWYHLRHEKGSSLAGGWRVACYIAGLLALALALLSPIDVLQSMLFLMHMLQHLLLMLIAPPLLLLANPLPVTIWGIPKPVRRVVASLFQRRSRFRHLLSFLTQPRSSWFAFVAILLAWHVPTAYNASLQNERLHDLEHLTFFLAAVLFWWRVIAAAPYLRKPLPYYARAVYLMAAMPFSMFLGVLLTIADQPLYTYYLTVPRLWELSALDDQRLGGAIMWIPGNVIFLASILTMFWLGLSKDNREGEMRVVVPPADLRSTESRPATSD